MCVLRWALLVLVAGSLSGAECTPCGCDCNTPAINTQEGKTIIGLGVFMALADGENELATALVKVTDICESLGYEETKQVFHGFADDYFYALEEVRGK